MNYPSLYVDEADAWRLQLLQQHMTEIPSFGYSVAKRWNDFHITRAKIGWNGVLYQRTGHGFMTLRRHSNFCFGILTNLTQQQEVGNLNTRQRLVFSPTLLSCSNRFLNDLQQNRVQLRLLYLLTVWTLYNCKAFFYDDCRNSRGLIDQFLLSISGQTHEFIIYAMRQRTRVDNSTICYCKKQIDVSF